MNGSSLLHIQKQLKMNVEKKTEYFILIVKILMD